MACLVRQRSISFMGAGFGVAFFALQDGLRPENESSGLIG